MSLYTLTIDLLVKMGAFQEGMDKAGRLSQKRAMEIEANMNRIATAVGAAFGTAATVAAGFVVTATKQVADLSREYGRLADLSGTSSVEFQKMAAGAHAVGMSHEKLADILKDVQDKIGDYVQTGGGAMADFFDNIAKRTGVTAEQMRKLSGPDALGVYFSSLEKANLSQSEFKFYMEAIASDSSLLIPLLRNGGEGFKRWGSAAEAAGAIIKNDTSKAMDDLRKITQEADLAFMGVKVQIAEGVIPVLKDLNVLLQDPQSQEAMKTATNGVVAFGQAALEAAGGFAKLVGDYTNWVKSKGFMPTNEGDSLETLNARRARVQDGLKQWTGVFGEGTKSKLQAELAEIDGLIAAYPWRDVSARVLEPESNRLEYKPTGNIDKAAREKAAKDAEAARKRQQDAITGFTREAEIAAGVVSGPLDEAMAKHLQRMGELNKALAEGNILQADAGVLMADSALGYAKIAKEIEAAQRAPEALLGTMKQEVMLLGLSGTAREMYRRQLQAEADMRGEIARAMEAGAKFSEEEISLLVGQARGYANLSIAMEEASAAAEDWQHVAIEGVGGVADVFADTFAGQIDDAKDFFSELKDVFKRGWWDVVRTGLQQSFVNPIQKAIQGMLSGQGFSGAGSSYGGIGSTIAGGIVNGVSRAGLGGLGVGAGALTGFGNHVAGLGGFQGQTYGLGSGAGAGAGGGGGGFGMPPGSGLLGKSLLTGEFAGGLPYAGAGLGLLGAYYGLTQRGSGGLSSILAGASYGALGLGVGGAIAGGMGAIGAGVGVGGIGAGAVGGAAGAMGAVGAGAWVPVVGWALAAAAVIDKISGGKVFGTKYKTDSSQQTIGITEGGGTASATANQSKQKALFGGKKRRTIEVDPGQESKDAAAGMHEVLAAYAKQLGVSLQQDAASLVGGTFSQTYDKKGNVTGERSTVLGRTYDEDIEAFQKRLAAEQAIAAVNKIDAQASAIAADWRKSAESLEDGANFFVAAAVDAKSGMDLWTGIGLGALTDFVEKMQASDENLQAAYSRLAGTAKNYGTLMADVSTQLMTGDLSNYQSQALTIERTYRQQVRSANDYAKALGLTGARAEDLAKIEALRATNMGKLQAQIEADKKNMLYGLSISELSPLTDQEKLDRTMRELAEATAKGDSSAAQAAAQAALGFGRDLFASGKDYNALYGQVTGSIGSMKLGDLDLEDGTSIGQLADAIEALPETFGRAVFEVAAGGAKEQAQTTAQVQQSNQLLQEQNELLKKLLNTAQGSASSAKRDSMNAALNAR